MELLQRIASPPIGSGQFNSYYTLPHCPGGSWQRNSDIALSHRLGAVGNASPAT